MKKGDRAVMLLPNCAEFAVAYFLPMSHIAGAVFLNLMADVCFTTVIIDEVLSMGKRCIVATGHVGTFPWLGVPYVKKGFPSGPGARDPHDERIASPVST